MKHIIVTHDGARMGYVEISGREPARIFLHGLGGSSLTTFTAVAADPAIAGHRTILVDFLGFGMSDRPLEYKYTLAEQAETLARFMDELALSSVDVIAHSMGGSIAIVLASIRPDLVARLVLCEPNLLPTQRSRVDPYSEETYVALGFTKALATTGDIWPVTMRMADPIAMYRSEHSLGKNMPSDLTDKLFKLSMPVSVIRGSQSSVLHCEEQIRASNIPIITITNAGHNMMLDNHVEFVSALNSLMQ